MVAQLEDDIERLRDVPCLRQTDKLSRRLLILRDHFQISVDSFDAVDRIRDARNRFVHDGVVGADVGCTSKELPGVIVDFLNSCNHPDY